MKNTFELVCRKNQPLQNIPPTFPAGYFPMEQKVAQRFHIPVEQSTKHFEVNENLEKKHLAFFFNLPRTRISEVVVPNEFYQPFS